MESVTTSKTREEVEALKRDWVSDPIYDLTGIEGFEAYETELTAFAEEQEAKWEADRRRRAEVARGVILAKADELGIPGNEALAGYVIALEQRVSALESRLDNGD